MSRGFADTVSKNVGAGAAQAAAACRHPTAYPRMSCPRPLPRPPLTAYSASIFSRKTLTSKSRQTNLSSCSNTFPPSARVCPTHPFVTLFPHLLFLGRGQNLTLTHQPTANGHIQQPVPNGSAPSTQSYPVSPQTPIPFSPELVNPLRAQIQAFKLLSRGSAVPDHLQQAMRVPNTAIQDLEKTLQGPDVQSRIVDAAVKASKDDTSHQQPTNGAVSGPNDARASPATEPSQSDTNIKSEEQQKVDLATSINTADLPNGPFFEDNVNSGIYPYNAFRHPLTHLKRPADADPKLFASRLQRLLIPTLMPLGLDAHQVLNERDRYVEARMQQRIRELEALPSTIGDGGLAEDNPFENEMSIENKENATPAEQTLRSLIIPPPTAHGKLRAAIELKALRLLDKQRALRALVAERLAHGSMLPLSRTEFRRIKKPTIRDARMTEQLERKQRAERERRAKHKHVEQLEVICNHGREVMNACRNAQDRVIRLGRAVLSFHAHTEKEEQKRIERLAKERLKALKADDEEAYMKLIDTAKDTRITHLLKQTDAYLDSLAQAVVAQQTESGVSSTWESEDRKSVV